MVLGKSARARCYVWSGDGSGGVKLLLLSKNHLQIFFENGAVGNAFRCKGLITCTLGTIFHSEALTQNIPYNPALMLRRWDLPLCQHKLADRVRLSGGSQTMDLT